MLSKIHFFQPQQFFTTILYRITSAKCLPRFLFRKSIFVTFQTKIQVPIESTILTKLDVLPELMIDLWVRSQFLTKAAKCYSQHFRTKSKELERRTSRCMRIRGWRFSPSLPSSMGKSRARTE